MVIRLLFVLFVLLTGCLAFAFVDWVRYLGFNNCN